MSKRKYEDVKGYWVYSIKVPSVNKYYIGVSKQQCYHRWYKKSYKGKSLEPYLDEWDSMIKTVLVDNLSKEDAYKYEDNIIRALKMNNLCINKHRSGLIKVNDTNAYNKQYYENNKELCKQWRENNPDYMKQWYENNKERQKQQVKQYYENNKEKIREKRRQRRLKKKLEKQNSLPLT